MPITRQEIGRLCQSNTIYTDAKRLQQRGCVNKLFIEEVYKEEITLVADVIDNRKVYKVNLLIREDTLGIYNSCTCGMGYLGICAHRAAALLEYVEQAEKGQLKRISSKSIRDLIYEFAYRSKKEAFKSKLAGNIEIIPCLKIEEREAKLSFKIGNEKKYVIRNLTEFAENVQEASDYEYGKKLKFVHDRAAFTKETLPLIDFILDCIGNYQHVARMVEYGYSQRAVKAFTLSEIELDRFMDLWSEKELEIATSNSKKIAKIQSKNPNIKIYITKSVRGAKIYCEDSIHILIGRKHIYTVQEDVICASDEAYKEEMGILLEELGRRTNRKVFLSQEDYNTFCATILPVLSKNCEIIYDDVEFEEYMPPATELEVYLDAPEKNSVTCKIYAKYAEKRYNIFEKFNPIEVYRDVKKECKAYILAQKYFDSVTQEKDQAFLIEGNEELLFLLLERGVSELQSIADIFISDSFKKMKVISSPKVSVGVALKSDLLELTLETGEMPVNQLLNILDSYKKRKRFHRLKNGEFISLEEGAYSTITELTQGLSLTAKDLKQNKIVLPQNRVFYLDKILKESNEEVAYSRDIYFKNLLKNMKAVEDGEFEIPSTLKSTLREYQKVGFRWLKTLAVYGFGGILADDMGLGKTLQVITFLLSQKKEGKKTSLIVCPASLIYNWESELEKFAPMLTKCIIAGGVKEREKRIEEYAKYDVLVTSYDLLKRDAKYYKEILFETQIIDEAQYIKNQATKAAKAVKEIHAKVKFALTGTPIENRLSEIWSIFDYLMPGLLYTYHRFKEEIEIPIVQEQDEVSLKRLHRLIGPFILRRLKKEVLKDLPDKLEHVIYSKMEGKQLELYQANVQLLKDNIGQQSENDIKKGKLQILAELTKLRQLCCDPGLYYESYQETSAKLEACMDLIQNGVSSGHKILLFSQFTTMLDVIRKKLEESNISYYSLTGQTPKAKRYQMVEAFNQDDTKVFLISLKAGGTGLNLTGADIVIHYDPWWNIAAQNQATDRAYRIGQKNVVSEFKLITKDSIEEKILKLQEQKKDLADKVVAKEVLGMNLDKQNLLELLS